MPLYLYLPLYHTHRHIPGRCWARSLFAARLQESLSGALSTRPPLPETRRQPPWPRRTECIGTPRPPCCWTASRRAPWRPTQGFRVEGCESRVFLFVITSSIILLISEFRVFRDRSEQAMPAVVRWDVPRTYHSGSGSGVLCLGCKVRDHDAQPALFCVAEPGVCSR